MAIASSYFSPSTTAVDVSWEIPAAALTQPRVRAGAGTAQQSACAALGGICVRSKLRGVLRGGCPYVFRQVPVRASIDGLSIDTDVVCRSEGPQMSRDTRAEIVVLFAERG